MARGWSYCRGVELAIATPVPAAGPRQQIAGAVERVATVEVDQLGHRRASLRMGIERGHQLGQDSRGAPLRRC